MLRSQEEGSVTFEDIKKAEPSFWRKVHKSKTGCWLWIASVSNKGYGQMQFKLAAGGHKNWGAHRFSKALEIGGIPDKFVLHKCDRPRCVRPDHLFLGTQKDNMSDMARKGRADFKTCHASMLSGEALPQSKLVAKDVLAIRQALAEGISGKKLAVQYGITEANVSAIKHGVSWKHLLGKISLH